MFRSGFAVRRRWFVLLTLLAAALALGVGGILWHSVETSSIGTVQAQVDALKPVLTGIRLLLIALMAVIWPYIANRLHRWGWLDAAKAAALHAMRWRIVTWLVVIELVLGQNLLGQVLTVLQESRA